MEDVAISDTELDAMRRAYDARELLDAEIAAFAKAWPTMLPWVEGIARTFYSASTVLLPVDRERCLIALLASQGASVALAIHVYWGLMEGLSWADVVQTIGLAGCYGGMHRTGDGLLVLLRLGDVLRRVSRGPTVGSQAVMDALVAEFRGVD